MAFLRRLLSWANREQDLLDWPAGDWPPGQTGRSCLRFWAWEADPEPELPLHYWVLRRLIFFCFSTACEEGVTIPYHR